METLQQQGGGPGWGLNGNWNAWSLIGPEEGSSRVVADPGGNGQVAMTLDGFDQMGPAMIKKQCRMLTNVLTEGISLNPDALAPSSRGRGRQTKTLESRVGTSSGIGGGTRGGTWSGT